MGSQHKHRFVFFSLSCFVVALLEHTVCSFYFYMHVYENMLFILMIMYLSCLSPHPLNLQYCKNKKRVLRNHSVVCVGLRCGRRRKSSSAATLSGMCWLWCLCVAPVSCAFSRDIFYKGGICCWKRHFFHAPFWPKMSSPARRDPH